MSKLYCDSCGKPVDELFKHYGNTYELCTICAESVISSMSRIKACIKTSQESILAQMGIPPEVIKSIQFVKSRMPSINPMREP